MKIPIKHIFHLSWVSFMPVFLALIITVSSSLLTITSPPEPVSAQTSIKSPTQGLLDRKGAPTSSAYFNTVNAYVVNAKWKDLQTSNGGSIKANNIIDQAIANTRAYNKSASTPRHLKLRLFAGIDAPSWAKSLNGGPYQAWTSGTSGDVYEGDIGYFWTNTYQAAYENFLSKVAAKYDGEPLIRDVTTSMCTTVYAEPMIIQISSYTTRSNLINAGYTYSAHKSCHYRQIDAQERYWKQTRSSLAFNPVQGVNANKTALKDMTFTHELIDYCRSKLGNRCVLENNSLRCRQLINGVWQNSCLNNDPSQSLGSSYKEMYDHMIRLGPPLVFQTAAPARIGNWRRVLEWAAEIGVNAVELNSSYSTSYSVAVLGAVDSSLENNAFPTDYVPPPVDPVAGDEEQQEEEEEETSGQEESEESTNDEPVVAPTTQDSGPGTPESTNPVNKIISSGATVVTEVREVLETSVNYVGGILSDNPSSQPLLIGGVTVGALIFVVGAFLLHRFHNAGTFKSIGHLFNIKPTNHRHPEFHHDPPVIFYPDNKH